MPLIIFRSFINARNLKKKLLFECKTLPVLIMIKPGTQSREERVKEQYRAKEKR